MLFQTLDKLKRQSILAAILMMALGVVMLICPESYVNTLVVTVGYGMIVFALVEMLEFVASRKALVHYILFTGALIIAILGVFILIYNQDLLKALGWLFGFVLVQDGLFTLLNALLFARRSNRNLPESLVGFAEPAHEGHRRRAPVLRPGKRPQTHLGVAIQK